MLFSGPSSGSQRPTKTLKKNCPWNDGENIEPAELLLLMEEILHHLIGSLSHYLQGFIHSRWCRIISSINSINTLSRTIGGTLQRNHRENQWLFCSFWKFRSFWGCCYCSLHIQIPPEKMFWVYFWGPNTFSTGVGMSRVYLVETNPDKPWNKLNFSVQTWRQNPSCDIRLIHTVKLYKVE